MIKANIKSILKSYGYEDIKAQKKGKKIIQDEFEDDFLPEEFLDWKNIIENENGIELTGELEEDLDLYEEWTNDEEMTENLYQFYNIALQNEMTDDNYFDWRESIDTDDIEGIDTEDFEDFVDNFQDFIGDINLDELIDFSFEEMIDFFNEFGTIDFEDKQSSEEVKLYLIIKDTIKEDISFEDAQIILEKFTN